jgi:hypothetical protein
MKKPDAEGEEPFVIEADNTCFIIQAFLAGDGIVFITTIREQAIRFAPDPASGNLTPNYYPMEVDRETIDAIANGIEKYCL